MHCVVCFVYMCAHVAPKTVVVFMNRSASFRLLCTFAPKGNKLRHTQTGLFLPSFNDCEVKAHTAFIAISHACSADSRGPELAM